MKEFNEIKLLKEFKNKSGWSNQRIGETIGVHGQTIQGWISGKYKPSPLAKKVLRSFLINYL